MKKEFENKCKRCNAKAGQPCINTKTGKRRKDVHPERLQTKKKSNDFELAVKRAEAAEAKKKEIATQAKETKKKRAELTDDQREIVDTIMEKAEALLQFPLKFVPPVEVGPLVTSFRFEPHKRMRVRQLEGLSGDFGIALGVDNVMVKRMPGEVHVAVFVPNKERITVQWRDIVGDTVTAYKEGKANLPLNFGVDQLGKTVIEDLTKLPHLLMAGSTNSGKSTLLASMIASLAYTVPCSKVEMVMSDTKGTEFHAFRGLPHLKFKVANSVYETVEQMEVLVEEMQKRLSVIGAAGYRNIFEYNAAMPEDKQYKFQMLVIDELADILDYGGSKKGISAQAEEFLLLLAAKARAAGQYIIAATQRPSVNVITGSIKANFAARLSFKLPSSHDSKTILGHPGAENLITMGDMFYVSPLRVGQLTRLHAPYATLDDIKAAVMVAKHNEETRHAAESKVSMPSNFDSKTQIM